MRRVALVAQMRALDDRATPYERRLGISVFELALWTRALQTKKRPPPPLSELINERTLAICRMRTVTRLRRRCIVVFLLFSISINETAAI